MRYAFAEIHIYLIRTKMEEYFAEKLIIVENNISSNNVMMHSNFSQVKLRK